MLYGSFWIWPMPPRNAALAFALIAPLLAGCLSFGQAEGEPSPSSESTLGHPAPLGSAMATSVVSPPASPTRASSSSEPVRAYIDETAGFSLQVPQGYDLYVGQKPSVDGVLAPLEGGLSLVSSGSPSFVFTLEHLALEPGSTLSDFVSEQPCVLDRALGQQIRVAGEEALLFKDTPCGPYGSTFLLLVRRADGFRVTIETHSAFEDVAEPVMDLLARLKWRDG